MIITRKSRGPHSLYIGDALAPPGIFMGVKYYNFAPSKICILKMYKGQTIKITVNTVIKLYFLNDDNNNYHIFVYHLTYTHSQVYIIIYFSYNNYIYIYLYLCTHFNLFCGSIYKSTIVMNT